MNREIRITLFYEEEKAYAFFDTDYSLGENYRMWLSLSGKKWPSEVYFIDCANNALLNPENCIEGFFRHIRLLGGRSKKC